MSHVNKNVLYALNKRTNCQVRKLCCMTIDYTFGIRNVVTFVNRCNAFWVSSWVAASGSAVPYTVFFYSLSLVLRYSKRTRYCSNEHKVCYNVTENSCLILCFLQDFFCRNRSGGLFTPPPIRPVAGIRVKINRKLPFGSLKSIAHNRDVFDWASHGTGWKRWKYKVQIM